MMQCANIFFILSIGFAPAALACSDLSADQYETRMKIISPEMSYKESTSKGIISYEFEQGDWKAASVRCCRIYLPNPQHQTLVIYDEDTKVELYSSDSETFKADEEYILEKGFTIDLTESESVPSDQRQARAQVECHVQAIEYGRS
ncbi:hypothetical protein Pcinc_007511 [Petrolisthes cinctipes]|uniref:Uncharacterized protein n=1 Tax=Petrolisthes cinctipes TaxID=88211 RepID=A0AAE1KYF2_PETCI|nr:hypothetical protein Pcinc_007511 [Petrolisthes cinctipes]